MSDYVDDDSQLNATFDDLDWNAFALPEIEQPLDVDGQAYLSGNGDYGIPPNVDFRYYGAMDPIAFEPSHQTIYQDLTQQPGTYDNLQSPPFGGDDVCYFDNMQLFTQMSTPLFPMDAFGSDLQATTQPNSLASVDGAPMQQMVMQDAWMQPDDVAQPGNRNGGLKATSHVEGPHEMVLRSGFPRPTSTTDGTPALYASSQHTNPIEKPFRCAVANCSRSFQKDHHLSRHQQSHQAKPVFRCNQDDCHTTFGRKAELERHKKSKLGEPQMLSCMAVGCSRTGLKGFARVDKLRDHALNGHSDECLFTCEGGFKGPCRNGPNGTPMVLTRDLMFVHVDSRYRSSSLNGANSYRTCPLPRCPKRFHLGKTDASLDILQLHLLESHERTGRECFAGLLRSRGYDPVTIDVVCPMCHDQFSYPGHGRFYHHLLEVHCHSLRLRVRSSTEKLHPTDFYDVNFDTFSKMQMGAVGDASMLQEIFEHHRTLLSLWPAFTYFPVWDDIKNPRQ